MATAAGTISSMISQQDVGAFEALHARFAETIKANAHTRRERLAIIVEGFRLFQSYGGYSSIAAYELYSRLQIKTRMNDARKAAMAITGEFPAREGDATRSNRMYNRIRTVAGILVELDKDFPVGSASEADVNELIEIIEESGGWRSYGQRGDNEPIGPEDDVGAGNTDDGGAKNDNAKAAGENAEARSSKAAKNDDIVFDVAGCRTLIEQTGITAIPSATIVAPTPRVALICGSDETNLSMMPLTGVPVDLLRQLQEYRPDPDEHASMAIKAWGHMATALQLFDRIDSSAPVDPNVEAYAGQDMKPSLPGIACETSERFIISASRGHTSMVVSVSCVSPIVGKEGLILIRRWVHGKGASSLISNLSSADHRAAYQDPELLTGGTMKMKFKARANHGTDRKDFTIDLKSLDDVPADYWLLAPSDDVRATTWASFDGSLASQTDLLKFAAAAGAAKSLKKTVKVAVSGAKELSLFLTLGTSKRNPITGCSVTGAPENLEVTAHDFARAIAFGQAIGADNCQLAIDPNGLLMMNFGLDELGEFQVAIPSLHEGKRERSLLRRVPR